MKAYIEMVHLQITKSCNLRCYFCGQWGSKGFFSNDVGSPMSIDDWNRVIDELVDIRKESGVNPFVMVWGGEPLVSPYFDEIITRLYTLGFKTGIVTNGVLIDKHKEVIKECVDTIHVSIDGIADIHNSIRGDGVYERVCDNLKGLKHNNVIVMSVITKQLCDKLPQFISELGQLGINSLYLQDMIGLNGDELSQYKQWFYDTFSSEAVYIDSWLNNDMYIASHSKLEDIIKATPHSFDVRVIKHALNDSGHCLAPFRHAHITWNGNVNFCTDFYDFSAGNVKESTLKEIFYNKKSEAFRAEIIKNNCPTCNACSWKNTTDFLNS